MPSTRNPQVRNTQFLKSGNSQYSSKGRHINKKSSIIIEYNECNRSLCKVGRLHRRKKNEVLLQNGSKRKRQVVGDKDLP